MKNFIAFRFNDNDFHCELCEAIRYVSDHATEKLTLESWRELVIRGTVAFGLIKRLDNWSARIPVADYRTYISDVLAVSEIDTIDDRGPSFEGYIYNTHTRTAHYYGY